MLLQEPLLIPVTTDGKGKEKDGKNSTKRKGWLWWIFKPKRKTPIRSMRYDASIGNMIRYGIERAREKGSNPNER